MEGKQHAGGRVGGVARIGLLEGRALIGESAHAAIAAEVMIEGAVLLDEDHHVVDVGDLGAGGAGSGVGHFVSSTTSGEERAGKFGGSGGGAHLKKFAARDSC